MNDGFTTLPGHAFRLPSLPQLLRWIGVAALTGAFAAFLFQGWQGGNDLVRYLMLLGLTLTLALGGVANGIWLREEKGARTFLALALGSLPVNFSLLGAFLYLHFGLDRLGVQYPQIAAWRIDSGREALILAALAIPLLAATARFAFSVHARAQARELSHLYLLGNGLIALPLRSPALVGGMVLGLTLILILALHRLLERGGALRTFEGRVALGCLFLPPLVLAGRALWLYAAGDVFLFLTALALHAGIRFLHRQAGSNPLTEPLSLLSATWAALTLARIAEAEGALLLPALSLGYGLLLYEIGYRRAAALIAAGGSAINLLLFDGLIPSLLALLAGIAMAAAGVRNRHRALFLYGSLLMGAGLVRQVATAIRDFSFDSWGTLALIGIAAVLAASLLERYAPRLNDWRRELDGWD